MNLRHLTLELSRSKKQVFATIYKTEGLEHHMAVERAHVSWTQLSKQELAPQPPTPHPHQKELYVNLTLWISSFISLSQSIFGKLDVDHDGDITEDEFIQVVHSELFWKSKFVTLFQLRNTDSELAGFTAFVSTGVSIRFSGLSYG